MSSEAARWVTKRKRDVRPALRHTLLTLATYADQHGRGMRPSAQTLADDTGKSVRQIKRDLADLRKGKDITEGDQTLVAHLHPEQRPVVYDLTGMAEEQPVVVPHRRGGRWGGVTHDTGGSDTHGRDPVSRVTPKTSPTGRDRALRASGSAPRDGATTNPPCERHAGQRQLTCGPCRSERIAPVG